MNKFKLRELVFQILYSREFAKHSDNALIQFIIKKAKVSKNSAKFAQERALQVEEKLQEIDEIIKKFLQTKSFERMSKIEKSILRVGVFELFFDQDIPGEVAISEGVRICRKFGSEEGAKFVNAVLDGSFKHHEKQAS